MRVPGLLFRLGSLVEDPYGALKARDENVLREISGGRCAIARIFNVGGPHVTKPDVFLLTDLISQSLAGDDLQLTSSNLVYRSFVDVEDIASWWPSSTPGRTCVSDTAGDRVVEAAELAEIVRAERAPEGWFGEHLWNRARAPIATTRLTQRRGESPVWLQESSSDQPRRSCAGQSTSSARVPQRGGTPSRPGPTLRRWREIPSQGSHDHRGDRHRGGRARGASSADPGRRPCLRRQEPGPARVRPGETPVPVSGKVLDASDLVALVESSLDGWLTAGRFTKDFERALARFVGARGAVFVNSGSSANLVALSALTSPKLHKRQIREGDEVLTVAMGFPTTINPIIQNRLRPVVVDVELGTYDANPEMLAEAVGPRTRAIMMAHTLGNPFDLDVVRALCKEHDLWLVEDSCDALGSTYDGQRTGSFGDTATISFYPAHHITTGEGRRGPRQVPARQEAGRVLP